MRDLVVNGSASVGCDPATIALPAITAVGVAVGNGCSLQVKPGWIAPPIVWTVVAMPSGQQKSPALDLVVEPFRRRQKQLHEKYQQETSKDQQKNSHATTCWTDDVTTEGLAVALEKNPRGILYASDELSGWLGAFGAYKSNGKVSDEAFFCSRYGARPSHAIRKTGDQKAVFADGFLGITGVTTVATLASLVGKSTRDSGLLARLLICCPPAKDRRWSEESVSKEVRKAYEVRIDELLAAGGQRIIQMSQQAKGLWAEYFNAHNKEQEQIADQDLRSAYSKLEEMPCRLASIFHSLEGHGDEVSEQTMSNAIDLTEWLKNETRRVYMILNESREDHQRRDKQDRVLVYLQRQERAVTARDVQTGCRFIKNSEEATEALEDLVGAQLVEAENHPAGRAGGTPTRRYRLARKSESGLSAQPPETRGKQGCADADACNEELPWETLRPI